MFKALLKTRMALLMTYWSGASQTRNRSKSMKILFPILMIYVVACVLFMFGSFFMALCEPFHILGIDWMYFLFVEIAAFALMFIGTIFMVQVQLYDAKDNDLLMAMPIKPGYILASRMAMLMVMNMVFELLIILPAAYVYIWKIGASFKGIISYILVFIALVFFSMALSSLIGWLITLITSRMGKKNLVTTILFVAFLLAYFYFYTKLNSYIMLLVSNGDAIANRIKGSALPLYWLGTSISDGNLLYVFGIIIISAALFSVAYFALSKNFIKLATTKRGEKKIKYEEKTMKETSSTMALIKKESAHIISNPMLLMNEVMGVIFLIVGSIVLLFKSDLIDQLLAQVPMMKDYLLLFAAVVVCMMGGSVIMISASAISLEGKSFWITRSMPVDSYQILKTKTYVQLVFSIPSTLFADIIIMSLVKMDAYSMILFLMSTILYNVVIAYIGTMLNLAHPKLDYINDIAAVKQGLPTILSMTIDMAILILFGMLYWFLLKDFMSSEVFLAIVCVVLIVAIRYCDYFLKTKGKKIFENI